MVVLRGTNNKQAFASLLGRELQRLVHGLYCTGCIVQLSCNSSARGDKRRPAKTQDRLFQSSHFESRGGEIFGLLRKRFRVRPAAPVSGYTVPVYQRIRLFVCANSVKTADFDTYQEIPDTGHF